MLATRRGAGLRIDLETDSDRSGEIADRFPAHPERRDAV
jgi:hypothetical protein